jgi:DNA (cytosine-5)-methyltransferase 1
MRFENVPGRFVSLFAGVGGFDLGMERAGHKPIGQVEIDADCRSVLKKHWPNVPKHDDVKTARRWANEQGFKWDVDFVCAGFPCQDVSVAGSRAGLSGARSGLFFEAVTFASYVEAKVVVLENVPGLLTSNQGRDFGVVLSVLADAGFEDIEWRVLDSQFFGVPQRRRRLFIVASSGKHSRRAVLTELKSVCGDSSESGTEKQRIATGTPSAFTRSSFGGWKETKVGGTLCSRDYKDATTIVSFDTQFGSNANVFEAISPTLKASQQPPSISNKHVLRRLTPTECEKLQGFPENWTEGQPNTARYRQMGNAVTVNVIEWIGKRLMFDAF